MRCFYHRDRVSFGTCKFCCRGICEECLVDVDQHGIACKDTCEDAVREIHELFERSQSSYKNVGKVQYRNGIIFGLFAVVLLVMYFIGQSQTDTFLNYAGGGILFLFMFFLLMSILGILSGRRFLRK